jgi:hypothetical protein
MNRRGLDGIDYVVRSLADGAVWVLVKIALVSRVSWKELRELRLPNVPTEHYEIALENRKKFERLALAKAEYLDQALARATQHTDSKVERLLVLATAVGTAIFVCAVKLPSWLWSPSLAALGATVALCLGYLGVWDYMSPDLPTLSDTSREEKEWALRVYDAYLLNDKLHATRVEIFRAARRWLFVGLLLASVGGLRVALRPRGEDAVLRAVEALRLHGVAVRQDGGQVDEIVGALRRLEGGLDSIRLGRRSPARVVIARSEGGAGKQLGSK